MTTVFWVVAGVSLGVFALVCAAPFVPGRERIPAWARSDAAFLAAAAAAFAALRWPVLFAREPFIDEAQMIAQAITAAHHPVPWRSFDGTTSGPLNTYALLLPHLAGMHTSLVSARTVAALLVLAALSAVFFAVRAIDGRWPARAAVTSLLLLFACAHNVDFVGYASELMSIALLAVALAVAAAAGAGEHVARRWVAAAGACCGAVPFAKLQGTPIALVTALLCLLAFYAAARGRFVRDAGTFAAAALAPAIVILGAVAAGGALRDFAISYVAQNLSSLSGTSAALGTALASPEYALYFSSAAWAAVLLACAWLANELLGPRAAPERRFGAVRAAPAAALVLLLVSAYAIEAPHRDYQHYFLFALVPLTLLIVTLAGAARSRAPRAGRLAADAILVAYVLAVGFQALDVAARGRNADLADVGHGLAADPVAQRIASLDPPRGRVAIWGYAPYLYVKSGTMMGTRDAISQFALDTGPYRDYYRQRFLADLEHNEPALFVDACAPGQFNFTSRGNYGFETFPELAAYVNTHYRSAGEVNGVRIYLRIGSSARLSRARSTPRALGPARRHGDQRTPSA